MATENLRLDTSFIGIGPNLETDLRDNFRKIDAAIANGTPVTLKKSFIGVGPVAGSILRENFEQIEGAINGEVEDPYIATVPRGISPNAAAQLTVNFRLIEAALSGDPVQRAPTITVQQSINPASGEVGDTFTFATGAASGTPAAAATYYPTFNGSPITLVGGTYTPSVPGIIGWRVVWSNGVAPSAEASVTVTVENEVTPVEGKPSLNPFATDQMIYDVGAVLSRNHALLPLSGTGDDDKTVQARAVRASDNVAVMGWTTVGNVAGGAWSGTLAGVPKTAEWLRVETRYLGGSEITAMTTRTFGTGHVIPIVAQSEHAQAIFSGITGLARPAATAQGRVQLWTRPYSGNNNPALIEVPGPIERHTISDADSVSAPMVAMANTCHAADPDARWAIIVAAKGGTSIADIVNDDRSTLVLERDWFADDALIRAGTENLTVGVTLVPFLWGTSASGLGKDAARFVGRFLTGRDEAGNILPPRTVVPPIYETSTITFDHSMREWFGDACKFAIIGPHRYERYSQAGRSLPLNFAPEIYASAENFTGAVNEPAMARSRQARMDLKRLAYSTEPGWAGRFVGHHGSPVAYLNGQPDAGDLVHPRKTEIHDGSPLFFAQTMQCVTHALGLQTWTPPVIDQVTWAADGSYVDVGTSAGPLTTTRRKRGEAAIAQSVTFGGTTYPLTHRTEVVGFEINGRPVDNATIVDGKIRITPPAFLGRNFKTQDRVRFGMGGASGAICHGYDVVEGLWKNWPILDVTLAGTYNPAGGVPEGIALEPAPEFAVFANTIAPSSQGIHVPQGTRFVDKFGAPGSTNIYENDRLGGSGIESQLFLEFDGKVDATQIGGAVYQLMGLDASSVNVAVRGATGAVDVTVRDGASTVLVNQTNIALPKPMLGNPCVLRLLVDFSNPADGVVRLIQDGVIVREWSNLVTSGRLSRTGRIRCYYSDLTGNLNHFAAWRSLAALTPAAAYVWIEGPAALANSHPWIDNGTVTNPPFEEVDSVVIVGQSLEQTLLGRSLTTPHAGATALMQAQGIDIPVYGYGFSGQRWNDADDYYRAARAAHPNALIMMHMGVNDVWQTKPYATLTPENRAALDASLADIATAAAGDTRFYHSSVAFCSFAAPGANAPVFMDPSQGAKPYNESLIIPWIATNWPHSIGAGGRPKVDHYRYILSNFENILQADGVHWTEPGNALILPWLVGEVAKIIKGQTPAAIPERVWAPPADWLAVASFGGSSSVIPTQIMSADVRAGTTFALRDVYDVDTGLTIRATTTGTPPGASLGDNSGGRTAGLPGGWNRTLYCAHISARNVLAASGYPITITIGGCAPGSVYEIGLLGTRNLVGPQQMQVSDGVTPVAWDCCEDPPVERHLTATASAGGIITLTASSVSGAQIHLSAISVKPV